MRSILRSAVLAVVAASSLVSGVALAANPSVGFPSNGSTIGQKPRLPGNTGDAATPASIAVLVDGTAVESFNIVGGALTYDYTMTTAISAGARTISIRTTFTDSTTRTSGTRSVTVSTSATPAVPTLATTITTDSGSSTTDRITNDTTPTFTGTKVAGAFVRVYDGSTLLGATIPDATTAWTFTAPSALADGARTITAKALWNGSTAESAASTGASLTVDTKYQTTIGTKPAANSNVGSPVFTFTNA